MPEEGFYLDYKESVTLGRYLQLWSENLQTYEEDMRGMFETLGYEVGNMILEEIPQRLSGNYGQFMADRTDFEVETTAYGFTVNIFGLSEAQVGGGRIGNSGQDYNLWEFYEFGGEVPGRTNGKGISITKDVASVSVVRTSASGFSVEGHAGAIQTLVAALDPRIQEMMDAALNMYTAGKIAKAANDAAEAVGIQARIDAKLASYGLGGVELPPDVIDVVETSISGRGGILQVRNSKGQFGKKIGVVLPK